METFVAIFDTNSVSCPNCNELQVLELDFIDGEEKTSECSKCKKKFKVVVNRPIEVSTFSLEKN